MEYKLLAFIYYRHKHLAISTVLIQECKTPGVSLWNGRGVTQDKTEKNIENKKEREGEKPRLEPNKIALEGTAFLQQDSVGCIPDAGQAGGR